MGHKELNSDIHFSIPPTSPSENYIEAGADYTFVPSDHNMPQFEMTWLTKNLKGDAKNELSNYQASSGTQTDGSSDVTAPNSKTGLCTAPFFFF